MLGNIWFIASFWMGLALFASLVSIRLGISVALVEILVGVIAGNLHGGGHPQILHTTEWTNFLAMLGSGVLTFLAGAEIDPASLRANLRASLSIGITITSATRRGHAAKTIVTFALEGGFDLIVLGHSDHSALWGRLLGDIADRVCDHSHCSVLVMKQ
jgi:nucleotide-binding universal stress UspA family protein